VELTEEKGRPEKTLVRTLSSGRQREGLPTAPPCPVLTPLPLSCAICPVTILHSKPE